MSNANKCHQLDLKHTIQHQSKRTDRSMFFSNNEYTAFFNELNIHMHFYYIYFEFYCFIDVTLNNCHHLKENYLF
jgi:hypothetical protein